VKAYGVAEAGAAGWALLLVAPFIGSFLGLIIRRLPDGLPIAFARSVCEECGVKLKTRDLVPVLSWLWQKGRCRYCGHPLGWFYPGVELAAVAVALSAVLVDGGEGAWLDCLLGWWLLTLGWIDLRRWLLPDVLTLPLVLAGLSAAAALDPSGLTQRALGAALGYMSLAAVAALYRKLRGREGLGRGDAKLLAAGSAPRRCRRSFWSLRSRLSSPPPACGSSGSASAPARLCRLAPFLPSPPGQCGWRALPARSVDAAPPAITAASSAETDTSLQFRSY